MLNNENSIKTFGFIQKILSFILIVLYSLFTFGPIMWVFTMSFKNTQEIWKSPYSIPLHPKFNNYVDIWINSNYKQYFLNSIFVVSLAVISIIVVASMAAYCFAKLPFKGSEVVYSVIFMTIMLPAQILLIPVFQILVQLKLNNSLVGLALVYIAVQMPMSIYILRSFFAHIPKELSEAARIDGCSEWSIFWKVMFPIVKPAISTILIINFVFLWNEYLYAVIFIQEESKRTLPLGIMRFVGESYQDLGRIAAGLIIAIAPVLVLYVIFSNKFIESMSAGAIKG